MKALLTFFILLSSITLFAQADQVIGDYTNKFETKEGHILEYQLALYQDGSFFFHYYSNIKQGIPPEVNKYGKGKWTIDNKVISFSANSNDLDEKHTLDFSNSKSRFITKSPRDKTDQIIKTKVKFLESELFWMKGIEMFKR